MVGALASHAEGLTDPPPGGGRQHPDPRARSPSAAKICPVIPAATPAPSPRGRGFGFRASPRGAIVGTRALPWTRRPPPACPSAPPLRVSPIAHLPPATGHTVAQLPAALARLCARRSPPIPRPPGLARSVQFAPLVGAWLQECSDEVLARIEAQLQALPPRARPRALLAALGLPASMSFWRLLVRVGEPAGWDGPARAALLRVWTHDPTPLRHCAVPMPAQIHLLDRARARGVPRWIGGGLLDAIGRAAVPAEVADAVATVLHARWIRGGARPTGGPAWQSIAQVVAAALELLARGEPWAGGPVPPPLALGPWARPLDTPAALQTAAQEMDNCLDEPVWARLLTGGLGYGWTVDRAGERATVWVGPTARPGELVLHQVLGPGNGAPCPAIEGLVEDALSAYNHRATDHVGVSPCTDPPPSSPGLFSLPDTIDALLRAVPPPHPIQGLDTGAPWETLLFDTPQRWTTWAPQVLTDHPEGPATPADLTHPDEAHTLWDPRRGVLWQATRAGRIGVRFWPAPRVLEIRRTARRPILWCHTEVTSAPDRPDPPVLDPLRAAVASIPPELRDLVARAAPDLPFHLLLACHALPALRPALAAAPCLGVAVLTAPVVTGRPPAALRASLASALDAAPEDGAVAAVLGWLDLPSSPDFVGVVRRFETSAAAPAALYTLAEAWAHSRERLVRVGAPSEATVALLDAAHRAGLARWVTDGLLRLTVGRHLHRISARLVRVAFDEIAQAVHSGRLRPRRWQVAADLAQDLLRARRALADLPPRTLPLPLPLAPDLVPLTDLEALGFQAWRHQAEAHTWVAHTVQGRGLALAVQRNPPATAWLRPGGLRGTVEVYGVCGASRYRTREISGRLRGAVRAHNATVARLPPGFTAAEAITAGLPAEVGDFRPQRTDSIAELVEAVLLLNHDRLV